MRKIVICLISLLCVIASRTNGQQASTTVKLHGQEVTVTASDGLDLHGWLTLSPAENAPLFVLLPMMGHTHTSYNPFIKALYERFKTPDSTRKIQVIPHILSLDLRGHGASTRSKSGTLSYQTMEPEEFKPYPSDVAAIIEKAESELGSHVDRDWIVIVGASIGANTAIMAAELVGGVSKVVMLSPGEKYRMLEPAASIVNCTGKIMIVAASEDSYSKTSSEKLAPLNAKATTLKVYDGPYHGTDVIDNNGQAMTDVLDWILN